MIGLKENSPGDVAAGQEVLVELLKARGSAEVIEMHTHCEAGEKKSAECLESEGELEQMRLRGRGRRLQMVSRAWRVFRVGKVLGFGAVYATGTGLPGLDPSTQRISNVPATSPSNSYSKAVH